MTEQDYYDKQARDGFTDGIDGLTPGQHAVRAIVRSLGWRYVYDALFEDEIWKYRDQPVPEEDVF